VTKFDGHTVDNIIFYKYQRECLSIANSRRIQHWFEIMKGILSKVQFPNILGLIDREELSNCR
jgi:hypothetical protein